jgi:hypothetical protein
MAPTFGATIEWQMKSSVLPCRISEGARVKGRLHRGSAALWRWGGHGTSLTQRRKGRAKNRLFTEDHKGTDRFAVHLFGCPYLRKSASICGSFVSHSRPLAITAVSRSAIRSPGLLLSFCGGPRMPSRALRQDEQAQDDKCGDHGGGEWPAEVETAGGHRFI